MIRMPWTARRRPRHDRFSQAGFTMTEVMVALVVGMLIFTGAALALTAAMSGVNYTRQNAQSSTVIAEVIEEQRSLDYANIGLSNGTADLNALVASNDITGASPSYQFSPGGGATAESLLILPTGGTEPIREYVRNGARYTVKTLISQPVGASGAEGYKRVVVRVSWKDKSGSHSRESATFITRTRRGLPLPYYSLKVNPAIVQPLIVATSSTLKLRFNLANLGARDSWNLSDSLSDATRNWDIVWYRDPTNDGDLTDAVALTDSDSDGRVETGFIETNSTMYLVGTYAIPLLEPGGTVTATLTAQSVAQSSVPSESASITLKVVSSTCTGCTYRDYYFRDGATAPYTATALPAPTGSLVDFDANGEPGRTKAPGATIQWRKQYTAGGVTIASGPIYVVVHVAVDDYDLSKFPFLKLDLHKTTPSSGNVPIGSSITSPVPHCGIAFCALTFAVPQTGTSIASNRYLVATLTVVNGLPANDDVWFAYDAAANPSRIIVPEV